MICLLHREEESRWSSLVAHSLDGPFFLCPFSATNFLAVRLSNQERWSRARTNHTLRQGCTTHTVSSHNYRILTLNLCIVFLHRRDAFSLHSHASTVVKYSLTVSVVVTGASCPRTSASLSDANGPTYTTYVLPLACPGAVPLESLVESAVARYRPLSWASHVLPMSVPRPTSHIQHTLYSLAFS